MCDCVDCTHELYVETGSKRKMKDSALINGVVITREQAEGALEEMNRLKEIPYPSGGSIIFCLARPAIVISSYSAELIRPIWWKEDIHTRNRVIVVTLSDGNICGPYRKDITMVKHG